MTKWHEQVLRSYMETAVWSSYDDDGEPLDKRYSIEDFTKAAVKQMWRDVKAFLSQADRLLAATDLDDEKIGRLFWLTRNYHGTGFWDQDLGDVGDELSKIAHNFGEQSIYTHRRRLHV